MNYLSGRVRRNQGGFTLIELLVVVLIIGILASIAVPQYFRVVEKGRFAEASSCIGGLKTAAENFSLKFGGTYGSAANPITYAKLDSQCPNLKFFNAPVVASNNPYTIYTITMGRNATANGSYGSYNVVFTWPPPAAGEWSCNGGIGTCADLLP